MIYLLIGSERTDRKRFEAMPELKNARHEVFAEQLAKGKSANAAYVTAGYRANDGNCIRLKGDERVKERVAELRAIRKAEADSGRDKQSGRFLTGNDGGPGRKRGSRNRLAEQFISDLHNEWQKSGASALERVAAEDPVAFVRVVGAILPKDIDATLEVDVALVQRAGNFAQAFRLARQQIADPGDRGRLLLELQAEEDEEADAVA